MGTYEPRQVREEAAISSHFHVPRGNLAGCHTRVLFSWPKQLTPLAAFSYVYERIVMAYIALYRKWRPKTFEDVVGQRHITETLQKQ